MPYEHTLVGRHGTLAHAFFGMTFFRVGNKNRIKEFSHNIGQLWQLCQLWRINPTTRKYFYFGNDFVDLISITSKCSRHFTVICFRKVH